MTKSNRKPQEPVALFEGLQLLRKDEIKILKCLLICDTVKDKTVKTADLISLTYAGYTETSRALNVLVKLGLMSPRLHRRGRGGAYHYTYDLERVSIVIDYLSVISTQDLGVGYKRKIGLIKICLENASKVPDSQTTHKDVYERILYSAPHGFKKQLDGNDPLVNFIKIDSKKYFIPTQKGIDTCLMWIELSKLFLQWSKDPIIIPSEKYTDAFKIIRTTSKNANQLTLQL